VTLKMHDLKMTGQRKLWVWKMQEWKMTHKLQFLRAISHSLGIHSAGFLAEEVDSDDENDDVNIDE